MTDDSLATIAMRGDALATLQALRDRVASELDATGSARDVASLSARLVEVLAEIAALEKTRPQERGTPLDELTKRRAAAAEASRPGRAARSK